MSFTPDTYDPNVPWTDNSAPDLDAENLHTMMMGLAADARSVVVAALNYVANSYAAVARNGADFSDPTQVRANLGIHETGTLAPSGLITGDHTLTEADLNIVVLQPGDNAQQVFTIPAGLGNISDSFYICQMGTGPVKLAAGQGVTLRTFPAGAVQLAGQYTLVRLWQPQSDVWIVILATSPMVVPGGGGGGGGGGTSSVPDAYSTIVTADNPIAYYRLDEASGTAISDQVTPGHVGTYSGTPTLGVTGLVNTADKAASLNGTSQYGSVPYAAALNPSSAFTVEAWVKPSAIPTSDSMSAVNSRQPTNIGKRGYDLGVDITTGFAFFQLGNGTTYTVLRDTAAVSTSAPTHLVGTWDGTNANLYVNGTKVTGPVAVAYVPNTTQALGIGAMIDSTVSQRLAGVVDEVAIYATALTATRVTAHHTAGSGSAPPSLAPTVTTSAAGTIDQNDATLHGSVDPNGQSTSYHFDYGLTTAYGQVTTAGDAGSGSSSSSVSASISGLAPSTAYHYRLVATNATGTTLGADMTLTTSDPITPPPTGGLPAATVYGGSHWFAAWVSKAPIAPADSPTSLTHILAEYDYPQFDISNAPQSGGVPTTATSWAQAVLNAVVNPRSAKPICYSTVTEKFGSLDQFVPVWLQPALPWSSTVNWNTWTGQHNMLMNSIGVSITTTDVTRHLMDPYGTPATNAWIDFVLNHLIPWIMTPPPNGLGFHGMFIDNSWSDLATMSRAATSGSTMPINPRHNAIYTEKDWADDVKSFFTQVVDKVKARNGEPWDPGVVICNMLNNGTTYNTNKSALQTVVQAGMDASIAEQWLALGATDPVADLDWEYNVQMVEDLSGVTTSLAGNPGCYIIDRTAGGGHPDYTLYSFASYLLGISATQKRWFYAEDDWTGFVYATSGRAQIANPMQVNEYRKVRDMFTKPIGVPQERRQSPQAGLWKRQYDHGIVVVNSNSSGGNITYALGGTYTSQDGTSGVTSVTLAPKTGFIGLK